MFLKCHSNVPLFFRFFSLSLSICLSTVTPRISVKCWWSRQYWREEGVCRLDVYLSRNLYAWQKTYLVCLASETVNLYTCSSSQGTNYSPCLLSPPWNSRGLWGSSWGHTWHLCIHHLHPMFHCRLHRSTSSSRLAAHHNCSKLTHKRQIRDK